MTVHYTEFVMLYKDILPILTKMYTVLCMLPVQIIIGAI